MSDDFKKDADVVWPLPASELAEQGQATEPPVLRDFHDFSKSPICPTCGYSSKVSSLVACIIPQELVELSKLLGALAKWRLISFPDTNPDEPSMTELDTCAKELRDSYDEWSIKTTEKEIANWNKNR